MADKHICVAIYPTHAQADEAFSRLEVEGLDMNLLSFAGRDYWVEMVGSRHTRGRFSYRGKLGAFWERLWANLPDWGVFCHFDNGPLLVAGRLVRTIVAGVANEEGGGNGGLLPPPSDLDVGLSAIGIPKESIQIYEKAVSNNQILLFAFGSIHSIEHVQRVLNETKAINHTLHHSTEDHED